MGIYYTDSVNGEISDAYLFIKTRRLLHQDDHGTSRTEVSEMEEMLSFGGLPILSWADDLEAGALKQAVNLSRLPFAVRHVALMADVHQGFGMPIGGVLAAEEMVIPNAVGVDIGCGVTAVRTDAEGMRKADIKRVIKRAAEMIPTGFKHHKIPRPWTGFADVPDIPLLKQELSSAQCQIGTLGGGNHFCSVEQGSDGHIWLMVHSGSRNYGYKAADSYNKAARQLNDAEGFVPREYNLAPLPVHSDLGREYLAVMNYCLRFARANRSCIFDAFFQAFCEAAGPRQILDHIDIHHNYAAEEVHFGKPVYVHRKGATRASQGEICVIPGSMGTPSYIAEGLGNPDSFLSCSHGAGRVISRKQANKQFTKKAADKAMGDIVFQGWHGDLSEAPMAYKDIERVIELQHDLVKPLVKLHPLGVMKG